MSMILYGKEINSDIAETNVCKKSAHQRKSLARNYPSQFILV